MNIKYSQLPLHLRIRTRLNVLKIATIWYFKILNGNTAKMLFALDKKKHDLISDGRLMKVLDQVRKQETATKRLIELSPLEDCIIHQAMLNATLFCNCEDLTNKAADAVTAAVLIDLLRHQVHRDKVYKGANQEHNTQTETMTRQLRDATR